MPTCRVYTTDSSTLGKSVSYQKLCRDGFMTVIQFCFCCFSLFQILYIIFLTESLLG